jgi:2-polyprenyl-3-methyl-5-hydroxy-6-metoxy-1,4-benzoquinol methylase
LRKGELRLVKCAACSLVYANPVKDQLASGEFYEELAPSFYLAPDKLQGDYAAVRFQREIRLVRQYCPRGKILDVGCSNGAFLFQLQERFPEVYETLGSDVAGAALDYAAAKGVAVRRGSFLAQDFAGEKFAAVTFWATLEHVVDPAGYLAKAAAVLEPGGHCFVLVPNLRSFAVRVLGPKYRYILEQHVNYFTAETLRALAHTQPEFRVVHLGSSHFNPLVIWQDLRGGAPVSDADRAQLLKRTNTYKQNPLLWPLKAWLGLVENTLATAGLADNLVMVLQR